MDKITIKVPDMKFIKVQIPKDILIPKYMVQVIDGRQNICYAAGGRQMVIDYLQSYSMNDNVILVFPIKSGIVIRNIEELIEYEKRSKPLKIKNTAYTLPEGHS